MVLIFGIGFSIFGYFSAGRNQILAALVSGGPFILSRILILLGWVSKRNIT